VTLIGTQASTKRYLSEEPVSEQTTLNGSNQLLEFHVTTTVTESFQDWSKSKEEGELNYTKETMEYWQITL
jgi:hypothetical protein